MKKVFEFKIKDVPEIMDTPIKELDINVRAFNGLYRAKIKTVGDLVDNWERLSELNNVGKLTVGEIKRSLFTWYMMRVENTDRWKYLIDSFKVKEVNQ